MSVDYKYKPEKHKFWFNLKTIDELHKKQLNGFKKQHESLPSKKSKLQQLKKDLNNLEKEKEKNNTKPLNLNMEYIKKRNSFKKSISVLESEIAGTENYKSELEYYSRTGDVIYDYYDITNGVLYGKDYEGTNEKNGIGEMTETNEVIHKNVTIKSTNTTSTNEKAKTSKIEISDELMAITDSNKQRKLKRPVRKRNKKIDAAPPQSIMSLLGVENDGEEDNEENAKCKASLQNEYLMMMDKEYACSKSKPNISGKCKKCGKDEIIIYNESILSCPGCGEFDPIFIESDIPSQRESFTEKPKYPYKKLGHCIEKLNQFLCKGTVNVPPEVMTTMEEEIKKHGMNKKTVTVKFLEKMLKKHRLSDQYENIMYIYTKITGNKPLTISREEYNLVLKMFSEAEDVYDKLFKPETRTNFLKYTFVLNKIFLTIGRKDIADHFKLLKSPTKMKEQQNIWRKICKKLGWKYHSS